METFRRRKWQPAPSTVSQRGAVLYVALIILILLALIGIVGMQVTGLQEKMSANYRNTQVAFQAAESAVRERECYLEGVVNRTNTCVGAAATISEACDAGFDPTSWAGAMAMNSPAGDRVSLRSIGHCISGNSSLAMGIKPKSEDPNPIYQVTIYATDNDDNPSADAAVDTIFRP